MLQLRRHMCIFNRVYAEAHIVGAFYAFISQGIIVHFETWHKAWRPHLHEVPDAIFRAENQLTPIGAQGNEMLVNLVAFGRTLQLDMRRHLYAIVEPFAGSEMNLGVLRQHFVFKSMTLTVINRDEIERLGEIATDGQAVGLAFGPRRRRGQHKRAQRTAEEETARQRAGRGGFVLHVLRSFCCCSKTTCNGQERRADDTLSGKMTIGPPKRESKIAVRGGFFTYALCSYGNSL